MGTEPFVTKLFGRTRSRIFAILFTHPERDFYVREIVSTVGLGSGSVQRDLEFLFRSDLISRSKRGNQVYYRVNREHPLYPELSQIVRKTSGAEFLLREALAKFGSRVSMAMIFGSFAAQQERANSDIDLLVVGSVGFGEVVEMLSPVQASLGREVNPVVYDEAEFSRKLKAGNHFLKTIMAKPLIYLWGDKGEFERLGRARLDRSA